MLRQVIDVHDLLDSARVNGNQVAEFLGNRGVSDVALTTVDAPNGSTDFVRIVIPGSQGGRVGGSAPTLGIIGRLGGIGARPERVGLVSDADGAVAALACALKLSRMHDSGDVLAGDVMVTTHVCPEAPIIDHHPVPFMDSPVDMATMNAHEVDKAMDAILVVDTTKGNRLLNHRGFAITPAVKQGYALSLPDVLLDLIEYTTGEVPHVLPIVTQDVTPYGNGLDHVNSLLQPATATTAPVLGVAITAQTVVPGSATGASREVDIEAACRFMIEVAKGFGSGACPLYDRAEFARLVQLYGSMSHLHTSGDAAGG